MTEKTQPTDEEIDAVTLEVLGYAALDKNTNETARLIVRAALARWGTPAPVGVEPVASKSHGAWDGIEDVLDMPDGTDLYTADQVLAMGRVPPGWTAVPVEPTDAMVRAMAAQFCGTVDEAQRAWNEAIAAAHGIKGGQHGADT